MSKQRINPIKTAPPTIDKASFQSSELLPTETVNAAIAQLTAPTAPQPTPSVTRNKLKKETVKGTVVFSAMIDKELMRSIRIEAAATEGSMSEVINAALRQYFKK
jgi:hypothetical protein